jgi:hypothetical protein
MLTTCRSHENYQAFLKQHIPGLFYSDPNRLSSFSNHLAALWLLDLDLAIPYFIKHYSANGRPAVFDPTDLFRSLVLMSKTRKFFGITEWSKALRNDRVLAVLSGFHPDKTPSVGIFYAFLDRFWLEFNISTKERRLRLRTLRRKPRQKKIDELKKGKKLPNKRPYVVARLIKQVLKGRRLTNRPERLIQYIFARCIVDKSISLGLIPTKPSSDPAILSLVAGIAGDGTTVKTAADPSGIKVCDCRKNGIYNCECQRRFSDYDANWGWDSHNELYFYGRTFYPLTATHSLYDLPVFLSVGQAIRHDSVQAVVALTLFRDLHLNLKIQRTLWVSAQDVYAFYNLHHQWDIEPFIDLNKRATGKFSLPQPLFVNQFGIPCCPAGQCMVFESYDKKRHRLKWRCPLKAGNKKIRCAAHLACSLACSPSSYGRTVYTKPLDDLRLFTKTPRNSDTWKKVYNGRSASERVNKRLMVDYQIEHCRVRSNKHWIWRGHFAAISIHLDAWVDFSRKHGFDIWKEFLPSLNMPS